MANVDITIQELKHEVKAKKSLDKKTKKQDKRAKKEAKKLTAKQAKKAKQIAKLSEKAGIQHATPSPKGEEGMGIEWTRRSAVPLEKVELKLDALFEPRGEEIQKRWKEKYGDDADIPSDMLRPRVDMENLDRKATAVSDKPAKGAKLGVSKMPGKLPFGKSSGKASSEPAGELSILDLRKPPEGLWLYQKFGDKLPKPVSMILMLVSLLFYILPMLPIRIFFFILFKILAIVKGIIKKDKKPAKS